MKAAYRFDLEGEDVAQALLTNFPDSAGSGQLTLGKLPSGIDNSSLTWVPVRLYSNSTDEQSSGTSELTA